MSENTIVPALRPSPCRFPSVVHHNWSSSLCWKLIIRPCVHCVHSNILQSLQSLQHPTGRQSAKAPGDALALMGVIAALGSDCPGKKPGEAWRNVAKLESKLIESTFFNLSIVNQTSSHTIQNTSFWFWFTDAPSNLWKEFHLIALLTWADLAPFKRNLTHNRFGESSRHDTPVLGLACRQHVFA